MIDKKLRKTIGSRTRARRKELDLTQDYLAEKLDVNKSTIQRYESGSIDNTKRLIVEGLANALHVSPEYLRGETDKYDSEIIDKRQLQIRDAIDRVLDSIPLGISTDDNEFAEDMLLLMLLEYESFTKSFTYACQNYMAVTDNEEDIAKTVGFASGSEYNNVQFLSNIMQTVNTFYELSELLRNYGKDPERALVRINALIKDY